MPTHVVPQAARFISGFSVSGLELRVTNMFIMDSLLTHLYFPRKKPLHEASLPLNNLNLGGTWGEQLVVRVVGESTSSGFRGLGCTYFGPHRLQLVGDWHG